ncbi:MAG TPA: pentapeptide repeat-containing protein [Pilimelia sp.]|nr:pentapeptide repeat-containing protein [Pilimelia sp.]
MPLSEAELLRELGTRQAGAEPFRGVEVAAVDVQHVEFGHIDLAGARFVGPVRFVQCRFAGPVSFRGAAFGFGATFLDCEFAEGAVFSAATFRGRCVFWRSRFAGPARFDNCVVRPAEEDGGAEGPAALPGETNFSWTDFAAAADFYRMQCHGPAWFWRPAFRGDTSLSEMHFAGSFRFFGGEHEVCVARRELTDPALFDRLLAVGVLDPDPETALARFGVLRRDRTARQLAARLAGHGLTAAEVAEVVALWAGRAVPALPPDRPSWLRAMSFGQPGRVEFSRVDLSRSALRDTPVAEIDLLDVTWARRRVFPGSTRLAAFDEADAAPDEYGAVRRLYGELAATYYRRSGYREASDFRYGQMEMLRRAAPAPLRWVSVLAGYRHLSGYGERYGLALALLLLLVFAVFPALYLGYGAAGELPRAVLHSLQISTFQTPAGPPSPGIAAHVVEAVHRVVVPVQAGLFALAVNRRLGRA